MGSRFGSSLWRPFAGWTWLQGLLFDAMLNWLYSLGMRNGLRTLPFEGDSGLITPDLVERLLDDDFPSAQAAGPLLRKEGNAVDEVILPDVDRSLIREIRPS